ncbi:unnamed protein product [Linum trigynum]|uniref:F-box domain-containing protein n=1 Tax=Linum trigynum TaxID=586398 RepID=A0AAV2FF80_9ROSI
MTENCSSGPLSSLPHPFAAGKWLPVCPEANLPPLPLNLFSKLGDNLLVEILIRLPNPRSFCRCKAVFKSWRTLISDPSFNRRFISHHQSRYKPVFMFLPAPDQDSILSFLPVSDKARPRFRVMDCFKDLLLCGFLEIETTKLRRSYLVCNPFTKQWTTLPLGPEMTDSGYDESFAALVCQSRSNCSLVQHLDEESEPEAIDSEYEFPVVRVHQFLISTVLQVFCSESGKWLEMSLDITISSPFAAVS